jgi:hypothetical protein
MAPPMSNDRALPLLALQTTFQPQPVVRPSHPNQPIQQPLQIQRQQTTHQPQPPPIPYHHLHMRRRQSNQPLIASNPVVSFPVRLPVHSQHTTAVPYGSPLVQAPPRPTSVPSRPPSLQEAQLFPIRPPMQHPNITHRIQGQLDTGSQDVRPSFDMFSNGVPQMQQTL